MTDSEKLDLLISEMQDMKKRIDKMTFSQSEIQKEMYVLNRKIADAYNVALDAFGTSTENRIRLDREVIA